MGFLDRFLKGKLDGEELALSSEMQDYAQIDLLARFAEARPLDEPQMQQRYNRVLAREYGECIRRFVQQGWLAESAQGYLLTPQGRPFVQLYQDRLARARETTMRRVRAALEERDVGEALDIRRKYEAAHPLGSADWSGPDPQLSRSSLTRRILYLDHWLLEGLSEATQHWLKLYAAEQHLWETDWRLRAEDVPDNVRSELSRAEMRGAGMRGEEAAYWRAFQLALYVDNQETWQRCKGGDHVRRIEIAGPDDEHTCDNCRAVLGQQFLVARVPELPHGDCTSTRGCRCRYEPVLVDAPDAGG